MSENAPARILIIDDEQFQMEALCNTLGDEGFETVGFTSATQGLAELRRQRFDLLLTDLIMPEMDGISLLQAALQIDGGLAGVIMTGQGTVNTAVDAMKTGALDYVLKPFKMSTILPVLSRALAVRRLRKENAKLQKRLRERTTELEQSNKELDAFASSVAHDLNAPVRHIGAFARILEEESGPGLNAASRECLANLMASTERLRHLISDLLDFSRLSHADLKQETVDLAKVLSEARASLEPEAGARNITWKMGELPSVRGDASLLQQVFCNLLSNAIKYTSTRAVAEIEVGYRNSGAGEHEIFVRDNGVGFDMQFAKKLFGVFQRLHSPQEFEGTGMGLANVRRIVNRLGGRTWAVGEVDKGATFYFTLPDGTGTKL
jgi:signal transduction histidine kinase